VIDIVPTILELTGIRAPVTVDGIRQRAIDGVSMAYSFDAAQAKAPSRRKTQYFEMLGNRAIYHDGWFANTKPINPPWSLGATLNPDVVNAYEWELYHLAEDWTQSRDLAGEQSNKLKELQQLFMSEAEKRQVLPLDNSLATRIVTPRPSVTAGRSEFTYSGPLTGIPLGAAPNLLATSYSITAEIEVPAADTSGIIATQGGRFGGWALYLLKGKPVFVWNLLDLRRMRWEAREALSPGKHTLGFDFKYEGLGFATLAYNDRSGLGHGGPGVLSVDGKQVATHQMPHTIPVTLQWDETFDIGSDTGTPVDDKDYEVPFAFGGKLARLTIKLDPPKLSPEDIKRLEAEAARSSASAK
jgi:arylsulfatase